MAAVDKCRAGIVAGFVGFLLLAAILFFLFVPRVVIENVTYRLDDDVNNYPQSGTQVAQEPEALKIYLGDRIKVSVTSFNPGLSVKDKIKLGVTLSAGLSNIDPAEGARDSVPVLFSLGPLYPFQRTTRTFLMTSYVQGDASVKVEIFDADSTVLGTRSIAMRIRPRPVSAVPGVPVDIVSYLGDRASKECQAKIPCAKIASGQCVSYPDSEPARVCLEERNTELFSGCEQWQGKDLTPWYSCLMRKFGFTRGTPGGLHLSPSR